MDTGIIAAGGQQLGERIFSVERHDLVPERVADRVQRDRQVHPQLRAAAPHGRHHAGRREGDAALGDGDALAVHDDAERLGHVVVIVERLAHAHHHQVGELPIGRR